MQTVPSGHRQGRERRWVMAKRARQRGGEAFAKALAKARQAERNAKTAAVAPDPTPEQVLAGARTDALAAAFQAISDCAKIAPLDQTIGITIEALAFAAKRQDEVRNAVIVRRIAEMKSELMGMLWE